jgi:glycosyltransferase involved in cell wall biosynthesis
VTLIVHVATRFFSYGGERSVADVVAALPPPDYRHILIVGRDHDPAGIRSLLGETPTVVVPTMIRRPDPIRDPLAARDITRYLRRLRPDLVHTSQSKSGILGRWAAHRAGVPAVVHSVLMANHGPGFPAVTSAVYKRAERLAVRWTDQYIVNGSELRDRFLRAGIGMASDYELIRSSVDAGPVREAVAAGRAAARRALGLATDGPIVLWAGTLDRRKGAHDLPGYFAALHVIEPRARLLVTGRGPLQDDVERSLTALGLREAVTFLGFTPRLPEAMAAADSLIMLSRAEGLATVLVFAAAAGRSFVSFEVDGPRELIERGATGAIAPIGDVDRAASLTAELLASPPPAPIWIEEWSPDYVRARYREVFERVLAGARSR